MCGTAKPTKPTGPQKAVTLPAKILVHKTISTFALRIFKPELAAYVSPSNKVLSDFRKKKGKHNANQHH
jgi:hypothetical protein